MAEPKKVNCHLCGREMEYKQGVIFCEKCTEEGNKQLADIVENAPLQNTCDLIAAVAQSAADDYRNEIVKKEFSRMNRSEFENAKRCFTTGGFYQVFGGEMSAEELFEKMDRQARECIEEIKRLDSLGKWRGKKTWIQYQIYLRALKRGK